MKKIRFEILSLSGALLSGACMLLAACAGNTPTPSPMHQVPEDSYQPQIVSSSAFTSIPESANPEAPQVSYGDEKDLSQSSSSIAYSATVETPQVTETSSSQMAPNYIDPYEQIPNDVQAIFEYADHLQKQGLEDSASAYLQRFRILKPLWNQWETRVDSMLLEMGKSRMELDKQYQALALEIQNMNRVKASYHMVSPVVDSLIALNPSDSLKNWAQLQKDKSFENTLAKAQKEKEKILDLADNKAQFEEAKKQADMFLVRYRDLDEKLQISAMIAHIQDLATATNKEAVKYWEKNDPSKALAQADSLIKQEKFAPARDLLNKLKASKLRREALQKYKTLSDAFCNKERQNASQLFAKAQQQKDTAKRNMLLQDAAAALDRCLTEYPETTLKKKIEENRNFLLKEIK
ncbi:MAG: hypothetical protein HUK21_07520 [Fibrobacteraceae bacterium]|nr:hypothetical protein [Fibrobacteraceae bacterium]